MIQLKNVGYSIGQAGILHDVSLRIPQGGVTALIGPNGAGKSTLLGLISRLLPLQRGEITVEDLKIGDCANDVLARKLAILSQAADVTPRLTVRQLVTFGRYPHHRGRPTETDRLAVDETLTDFDLAPLAGRILDTLSGGQRQRALIAMVFAQQTPYLLLDEPLNNLDIAASRDLMQKLQRLCEARGRTIVIVIHDINYAARYAARVVALAKGRVCADGPPGEVITSRNMREIFGTDADVTTIKARPVVLL